jgi:hypothetical protein
VTGVHIPRADVYRNLHLGRVVHGWSVRVAGLVKHHAEFVVVRNARFVVGERARQTVIVKKRRSVHAVVRGEVMTIEPYDLPAEGVRRVSYNPYKAGHFYLSDSGEPIHEAVAVLFTPDGCFTLNEDADAEPRTD